METNKTNENAAANPTRNTMTVTVELPAPAAVAGNAVQEQKGVLARVVETVKGWAAAIKQALRTAGHALLDWAYDAVLTVYRWVRSLVALLGRIAAVFAAKVIEILDVVAQAGEERARELEADGKLEPAQAPRS